MPTERRSPQPRRRERKQSLNEASIAGRVARVVDNLQKDRLTINNPFELCRRADMAMVATLQLVTPVLPETVQEQVQSLISIHEELYQSTRPSTDRTAPDTATDEWVVPEVERGECTSSQAAALGLPYRHRITGESIAEWTERRAHEQADHL